MKKIFTTFLLLFLLLLSNNLFCKEIINNNSETISLNTIKVIKEIPVTLVIITNSTLYNKFVEFSKIKNREGIKSMVVTTATTGSTPSSIRTYLHNLKISNPNLKYVLIGGDASIIPSYMIHNPNDYITWDEYPDAWGLKFPTDFYYSNVLSTWTDNLHNLTYNYDLYVGRIPANTTTEVQNFITKYINYRYNTDSNYTKKYRFISNNYSRIINYPLCDSFIINSTRKLDSSITKQITFDQNITTPTAVTVGNILNEGNYSFLFTYTHGGDNNSMACINNNVVYPPNPTTPDYTYMNLTIDYNYTINGHGQMPASTFRYLPNYLTNSQSKPYFFWLGSCGLSRFQKMSTSNPNTYLSTDCYSAEFMNNNDGAVAILSSSYYSYVAETFDKLGIFFNNLQRENTKRIGYLLSLNYINDFQYFNNPSLSSQFYSFLSQIYFGDPSMDVWYKESQSFNVSKNYIPGRALIINVSIGNGFSTEIPISTVTILNSDDTVYLRANTDSNGSVTFNTTADLSTKKIAVYKDNVVPYYNTLTATPQTSRTTQLINKKNINDNNIDIFVKVLSNKNIMFNISSEHKFDYQIDIYNMKGQKINTISNDSEKYTWNGKNSNGHQVRSGIYLYKFKQNNSEKIGKFIIVK